MELTLSYILSQIFVIVGYIFLAVSYHSKDRTRILMLNFGTLVMIGISYFFLSAYTGLAMIIIALTRNLIFLYDEKKYGKTEAITKRDIAILVAIYVAIIIATYLTYTSILSLSSVLATVIFTYSVWQKKTSVYKGLGIPVVMIWIIYNVYIMSLFGIILETTLLLFVISGLILELRKKYKRRK